MHAEDRGANELFRNAVRVTAGQLRLINERLAAGDWEGWLWAVPRPLRLDGFCNIRDRLTDSEYWELLRSIWIDTELPNQRRRIWLELFNAPRTNRDRLMDNESRARFDSLPDPVRIYRGCSPKYARGMAWTTDIDTAAWFAHRLGGNLILTAVHPKGKVLAFFNGRNESEVVIDPRRIKFELLNLSNEEILAGADRRTQRTISAHVRTVIGVED